VRLTPTIIEKRRANKMWWWIGAVVAWLLGLV